ncbi:MAG TPA: hypothetical protein VIL70_06450, partial [Chthoniobacterales bacterium]
APLQLTSVQKYREHNIRAMFVAGLAVALEIPTLIIHPAEFSPPWMFAILQKSIGTRMTSQMPSKHSRLKSRTSASKHDRRNLLVRRS